jgi:hypothetical protein
MLRPLHTLGLLALTACAGGSNDDTDTDAQALAASGAIDVLLVVDTSASLADQMTAVALDAGALSDVFAGLEVQIGITTLDPVAMGGALLGSGAVAVSDVDALTDALLCESLCWSSVPSDPSYLCGDPFPQILTEEFLTCMCGEATPSCGGAKEEGLESAYLATCASLPATQRPGDCGSGPYDLASAPTGMFRPGASPVIVVVSDEGDSSTRADVGSEDPAPYRALLAQSAPGVRFFAVAPVAEGQQVLCSGLATWWGLERYARLASQTGGAVLPLYKDDCSEASILDRMHDLAAALGG